MPRAHTHYDNLKVARDAPLEVIRAAYRSLAQKYHPDRNLGDPNAVRIMAIINAAYEVLSDPVKRRQHDEWIRTTESQAELEPTARPRPSPRAPPSPAVEPVREFDLVAHVRRYWLAYGVLAVVAWVFLDDSKRAPPPSRPPVYTPTVTAPPPAPPPRPAYVRPALAPNGQPWPTATAYVVGYPRLYTNGLSSVTVDNTQNDSDVFVKLVNLDGPQPLAVRVFFIQAGRQFRLSTVRAGAYDIRYRDLDSGALSKSEAFDLDETQVAGGTQYSDMRLTLYTVRGGNMRMQSISEGEF